MTPFTYHAAATEKDAITNAIAGGRYIAGGTTLIDLMREEVERPTRLIDINQLPMKGISETADGLVIGALARMAEVAAHPAVAHAAATGREAAGRRLATAAQHGVDRRQPAATRAVPLFPHARCGLQQA